MRRPILHIELPYTVAWTFYDFHIDNNIVIIIVFITVVVVLVVVCCCCRGILTDTKLITSPLVHRQLHISRTYDHQQQISTHAN